MENKNEKGLSEKLKENGGAIVLGRKNPEEKLSMKNLAALSRLYVMCSRNVNEGKFKPFTVPLIVAHQYIGGKGIIGSAGLDELRAVFFALNERMRAAHSIQLQWELAGEEAANNDGSAFTSLVKISAQKEGVEYSYIDGLKRDECRESSAKRGAKTTPAKTKPAEGVTQSEANAAAQAIVAKEDNTLSAVEEISAAAAAIFKTDGTTLAKFEAAIASILARYIEK